MKQSSKNPQNTKKVMPKKEKTSENSKFNIFAMGILDFVFVIEFKDNDLIVTKDGNKKEIKLEDIKKINDLEFIKDNKELIKNIKLKTDNELIKQFLLLKKVSKGKRLIEFFPICCPKFHECLFFSKIFDEVTSKYGILVNKKSLDKNQTYSIKFELIHKKSSNYLEYVEDPDRESDMDIVSEHIHKNQSAENNGNDDGEENEAMKKGLIPKFKRKKCMLANLYPSLKKYDLIYLKYNDLNKIEGDFEADDLLELINFFKEKKTKVFVNYYQSIKSELVEPPKDDDDEEGENKNEEGDGNSNNINSNSNDNQNENENNEQEDKDQKVNKSFSNQNKLNKLYKLTDVFFFDQNQAYNLFDKHLKSFSNKKSVNNLNKNQIFDYFMSSICDNNSPEEKIGLFLNNLENFTVITCNNKNGSKEPYDSRLYPQRNTRNNEIINQYKTAVQQNKDEYYNIFCSLMLGALSSNSSGNIGEDINLAFTGALTIIKKELECNKNKLQFEPSKLIDYKSIKNAKKQNKGNYEQKGKEEGFILDCTNNEKSKMKEYNPLTDKNLKYYFKSPNIKKDLKSKGFIDRKGYLYYDKEHKDTMGSPSKIANFNQNSRSLTKIIENLEVKENNINFNKKKKLITINLKTQEKLPK